MLMRYMIYVEGVGANNKGVQEFGSGGEGDVTPLHSMQIILSINMLLILIIFYSTHTLLQIL